MFRSYPEQLSIIVKLGQANTRARDVGAVITLFERFVRGVGDICFPSPAQLPKRDVQFGTAKYVALEKARHVTAHSRRPISPSYSGNVQSQNYA